MFNILDVSLYIELCFVCSSLESEIMTKAFIMKGQSLEFILPFNSQVQALSFARSVEFELVPYKHGHLRLDTKLANHQAI